MVAHSAGAASTLAAGTAALPPPPGAPAAAAELPGVAAPSARTAPSPAAPARRAGARLPEARFRGKLGDWLLGAAAGTGCASAPPSFASAVPAEARSALVSVGAHLCQGGCKSGCISVCPGLFRNLILMTLSQLQHAHSKYLFLT